LPAVLFALVALNAVQMVRERPLVYVEGTKNIEARRPYEASRFRRFCARCSPSGRAA
jgi:hypothetical protein